MSDEQFDWYRRYYKDFLIGIVGMSWPAVGGYQVILDHMWDRGPMSFDDIRKTIPTLKRRYVVELSQKLSVDVTGLYFSPRLERERKRSLLLSEKNSKNGKLGGRPALKSKAIASQTLNPNETQTKANKGKGKGEEEKDLKKDLKREPEKYHEAEKPDDVNQQTWDDFLKLRTKKKAPYTFTAMKNMKTQAIHAGKSLEQVLAICCDQGWTGYKPEWDHSNPKKLDEGCIGRAENFDGTFKRCLKPTTIGKFCGKHQPKTKG